MESGDEAHHSRRERAEAWSGAADGKQRLVAGRAGQARGEEDTGRGGAAKLSPQTGNLSSGAGELSQNAESPDTSGTEQNSYIEEIFSDPTSFDFLSMKGKPYTDLRKISLYMKFDPCLLSPRNTQSAAEGFESHDAIAELSETDRRGEDFLVDVQDSDVTAPFETSETSRNGLTEGVTETCLVDISYTNHQNTSDAVKMIDLSFPSQKKERLLILRDLIVKQEHKYRVRLQQSQNTLRHLDRKLKNIQGVVMQKSEQLQKKCDGNLELEDIITEFEKTTSNLKTQRDDDVLRFIENKAKQQKELEDMKQHLSNTEKAYEDLYKKYQTAKNSLENIPPILLELKDALDKYVMEIESIQDRFVKKKEEASSKCERLNEEMASLKQKNEVEICRLTSLIKKSESRIRSLKVTLEQKTKENKTLISLCDDLLKCELKECE